VPVEVLLGVTLPRAGGPGQWAALALLVCHANRVVSHDQLLEELLTDHPAQLAGRMLRVQISACAKALADSGDAPCSGLVGCLGTWCRRSAGAELCAAGRTTETCDLMKRHNAFRLSIAWTAAFILAACSGSGSSDSPPRFNAAVTGIVNPSSHRGGTLTFGLSGTPDSTDPGNTYYAWMWDLAGLYTMPLMTYAPCPGACGLQVVPDLATGPGVVSDNGLTWTYHIQPDVKFEDGTMVTSADVKYAIERTFDRALYTLGPGYYAALLGGNASTYPGPYEDPAKNKFGLTAIGTPNATTIVFHLAKPFADFNYVTAIPQSAPVEPSMDTGANYQLHPMSTGPYKFHSYQLNRRLTLVPNTYWKQSTDPNAHQLVSKITVTMGMNAHDLDNRLLAGDLDVDLAGAGVQAATRARILSSPSLKAQADDPFTGFLRFAFINTKVPPLTNVHCRIAVEYAANKLSLQAAYGGPYGGSAIDYGGGAIASTVAPPNILGHKNFDLYQASTKPHGDTAKARAELAACGQPKGFTTGIAYRSNQPTDVAAATALQAALRQVGIKASLHGYPTGPYFSTYAGVPAYVHRHDLGIDFMGWAPDWADSYGFFRWLFAGDVISPRDNSNIAELNDPVVNNLLNKVTATNEEATRNFYLSQIDLQVMKDAAILPAVYSKALLYRSPQLTNVYVQPFYGTYNYAVLGLK
jgi:peptide/nickel transport system substrate-binding protein